MKLLLALGLGLYSVATIATLLSHHMFQWVIGDFLICALMALAFMTVIFFIGRYIRRYDLVDAAWGSVFIVIAVTSFFLQPGTKFELDIQSLVTLLVIIWGGRLTYHILRRIKATDKEDPRYVELRREWKGNLAFNIFTRIYVLQAVMALLISIPVIHINLFADNRVDIAAWVGLVVWIVGFYFEATGDAQLRRFISVPANKGKLMNKGLWKYSRHPNYFGELTQWWGIFIICLSTQFGWVGVIGPVIISYLIIFVSGIPLNEKRFEGRSGWKEYKQRTSKLIPFPPRKA
jgi:steroid 5-alpha reductase family enzyme